MLGEIVIVEESEIEIVSVAEQGPSGIQGPQGSQGPQGPPGINTIGNYAFKVQSLTPGDLLMFDGSDWINANQTTISDGGNF